MRRLPENYRKQIRLPENINEYITLCSSAVQDTFILECFTDSENQQLVQDIRQYQEMEYEAIETQTDSNTGFTSRVAKVCRMDQSIGESLKQLYNNCCMITAVR